MLEFKVGTILRRFYGVREVREKIGVVGFHFKKSIIIEGGKEHTFYDVKIVRKNPLVAKILREYDKLIPPVKVGDEISLRITFFRKEGTGGKYKNYLVYVEGAGLGKEYTVRIIRTEPGKGYGIIK